MSDDYDNDIDVGPVLKYCCFHYVSLIGLAHLMLGSSHAVSFPVCVYVCNRTLNLVKPSS